MSVFARAALFAVFGTVTLSSCSTPYPNGSPIEGATLDANRAPRGSAAFCDTYARQTAANTYEAQRDTDSGSGYNTFQANLARREGRAAYERCLAGRTG